MQLDERLRDNLNFKVIIIHPEGEPECLNAKILNYCQESDSH